MGAIEIPSPGPLERYSLLFCSIHLVLLTRLSPGAINPSGGESGDPWDAHTTHRCGEVSLFYTDRLVGPSAASVYVLIFDD